MVITNRILILLCLLSRFLMPDVQGRTSSWNECSFSIPDKLVRIVINGTCNNSLSYCRTTLNEKISPYTYCANNPVNYVDPSGMSMDWVQDKLKRVYWEPNAKSQASTKAGETYLGQTVNAMDQEGNFGYGDQYGKWWNSAPLGETAVNGIRAIGSDHISAAMRNSARGYDEQWINGSNQFLGVGLSAINFALNATSIAKELADFAGGMRVGTVGSATNRGVQ